MSSHTAGEDFIFEPMEQHIQIDPEPGVKRLIINVDLQDNKRVDVEKKTFTLELTLPKGVELQGESKAIITIEDDDSKLV